MVVQIAGGIEAGVMGVGTVVGGCVGTAVAVDEAVGVESTVSVGSGISAIGVGKTAVSVTSITSSLICELSGVTVGVETSAQATSKHIATQKTNKDFIVGTPLSLYCIAVKASCHFDSGEGFFEEFFVWVGEIAHAVSIAKTLCDPIKNVTITLFLNVALDTKINGSSNKIG